MEQYCGPKIFAISFIIFTPTCILCVEGTLETQEESNKEQGHRTLVRQGTLNVACAGRRRLPKTCGGTRPTPPCTSSRQPGFSASRPTRTACSHDGPRRCSQQLWVLPHGNGTHSHQYNDGDVSMAIWLGVAQATDQYVHAWACEGFASKSSTLAVAAHSQHPTRNISNSSSCVYLHFGHFITIN
jgi:hypothetical protein